MEPEYQKQNLEQSKRTCGAACLSMVYKALGNAVPQDEIWPAISKENSLGSIASTTHLMVKDALARGFSAIGLQARHPLQVLRICQQNGWQAILNLRLDKQSGAGHYAVLAGVKEQHVVLHDPQRGPSREVPFLELLELWQPCPGRCEITGNVLLVIGKAKADLAACRLCGAQMPAELSCPSCRKPVKLDLAAVPGCCNEACAARMWNYLCCPACDKLFGPKGELATVAAAKDNINAKLDHLFEQINRFVALAASVPNASLNADLKAQLDFMMGAKDKLKAAHLTESAHRAMVLGQYAELARVAGENQRQAREQRAERERPLEALNAQELGAALMKNLGLA